jgi:hypothetical protein
MTTWKKLGTYLSRAVKLASISSSGPQAIDGLGGSVVLVVLGGQIPVRTMHELLRVLALQQPLAIVLSGVNASSAFDVLIEELSVDLGQRHIMTGLIEGGHLGEAIEGLLQATWPSEERFDEWVEYAILNVDGDSSAMEQTVRNVCR